MATSEIRSLPPQYDHAAAQEKWYAYWEERGYFHAEADDPRSAFSVVIPPPNVTGALHLGHALNNTLQDILVRMKRMQGFNTLWMPGTDHAGIATQAVVERRLLDEEGKSRHDLGETVDEARKNLVERIWKWKEQYEARILGQLRQLGCSCDWARTRFTLDDQCARAVREWFFRLFADGKIYRGKRLVNWDTYLQTAVSDDEVFHEAVKGHFWHFKYPVVESDRRPGEPEFVTIATTRPETMLGDTAVAVHPDPAAALDKASTELREKLLSAPAKEKGAIEEQMELLLERRAKVLPLLEQLRDMARRGVTLELPLTDRRIPLITDEWAKPELGSGCVKITPAHDENDYAVWQRHPEIGAINIMNPDGTLNDSVPEKYRGLKMHTKAREAVVADMEAADLYNPETDREDREIDLAHSDRSKTPIEPYLADQWFMKMDDSLPLPPGEGRGEGSTEHGEHPSPGRQGDHPLPKGEGLAQMAMDAVTDGRVKIVPERYAKGYLDWLSEKRDWPIGRQLWWGHRIPVWFIYCRQPGVSTERFVSFLGPFLGIQNLSEDDIAIAHDERDDHRGILKICALTEKVDGAMQKMKELREWPQEQWPHQDVIVNPELEQLCLTLRSCVRTIKQEDDVLDTWFSSALWPQSTMGWPDLTRDPPINNEVQPETGHNRILAKFYPTSVLITSRDIITLWVARMVLAGLYNTGKVPFHQVYITPKILDGYGETMSKSKGNGVDPLDVIDKFGADALRFGIAHLTTDTQDVKLPVEFECPHCGNMFPQTKKNRQLARVPCEKCGREFSTQWAEKPEDKALPRGAVVSERFELGRNFCNKLWNASRFALMNLEGYEAGPVADADLLLEDRWLLSRLATVTGQVTDALENFRYADAARTLYDFAWDEFCSFYVEMTKARFGSSVGGVSDADSGVAVGDRSHNKAKQTAQRVLAHALDVLLRLLHPMIPFLTEEVWQLLKEVVPERGLSEQAPGEPGGPPPRPGSRTTRLTATSESVCIAPWPAADTSHQDATIEEQFADFQAVLGAVREIRSRQNIPMKESLEFSVRCDAATARLLEPMQPYFTQMARATATAWGPKISTPDLVATVTLPFGEAHVDVSRFIDVDAERGRLTKQRDELAKFAKSIAGKLANDGFVSRAPADVVQKERDKLADVQNQLTSVEAALGKLG